MCGLLVSWVHMCMMQGPRQLGLIFGTTEHVRIDMAKRNFQQQQRLQYENLSSEFSLLLRCCYLFSRKTSMWPRSCLLQRKASRNTTDTINLICRQNITCFTVFATFTWEGSKISPTWPTNLSNTLIYIKPNASKLFWLPGELVLVWNRAPLEGEKPNAEHLCHCLGSASWSLQCAY